MATKSRSQQLLDLLTSGKATAQEKIEFAKLLQADSEKEAQQEKDELLEKAKQAVIAMGVDLSEFVQYFSDKPQIIFTWIEENGNDHQRYEDQKGKFPSWVSEMKTTISKEQALKLAGTNEKGKKFVEAVYKTA